MCLGCFYEDIATNHLISCPEPYNFNSCKAGLVRPARIGGQRLLEVAGFRGLGLRGLGG